MSRTERVGSRRTAIRGQLLFLAAVGVVAVVLSSEIGGPEPAPDTAPASGTSSPAETAQSRSEQLPRCPEAGEAPASGPLAAVTVACLGSGTRVELGAVLAGRPALINLWASWCGPCRTEIPVLDAYASQPDAVRVFGVNVEDRPAAAAALFAELGARYPSFVDDTAASRAALAAPPVLPITYLVREDGSVTRITDPAVFEDPDQIRAAITEAE